MTARPIGVLEMQDEAGIDEKVLAVPDRDPRFEEVRDLDDLPAHLVKEVEYFFRVYKDLEGKEVSVFGWHPRAKAYEIIEGAVARFRQREGH
jgi:inorganic pyrophosphatase